MKIDVKSRYKLELISLLLISCCTKATQDFFIVTKSQIFGQAGFLGGSGTKSEVEGESLRAWFLP
jgi:hypothetical protein